MPLAAALFHSRPSPIIADYCSDDPTPECTTLLSREFSLTTAAAQDSILGLPPSQRSGSNHTHDVESLHEAAVKLYRQKRQCTVIGNAPDRAQQSRHHTIPQYRRRRIPHPIHLPASTHRSMSPMRRRRRFPQVPTRSPAGAWPAMDAPPRC